MCLTKQIQCIECKGTGIKNQIQCNQCDGYGFNIILKYWREKMSVGDIIEITDEMLDSCPNIKKNIDDYINVSIIILELQNRHPKEELEILIDYISKTKKKDIIKRIRGGN